MNRMSSSSRPRAARIRVATLVALTVAVVSTPIRPARAEPRGYRPAAAPGGAPSVRIDLPYTFGTHNFEVSTLKGEVRVDWQGALAVTGRLVAPLSSVRGGSDTLNCHMREAMGLDYSKSAFPGSHVCSGGQLPATGNDAVAFPEIAFEIKRVTLAGERSRAGQGDAEKVRVSVAGRWTIHGISRDDTLDLQLTVPAGESAHPRSIRVEGLRKIRLADYGIKVKRALVVSAGDDATVHLDLLLKVQE